MGLVFKQAEFGSSYYEQSKVLRNDVLRVPLGLALSEDDVADDKLRMHFVALDGETVIGTVSMKPLNSDTVKLRQMAVAADRQGTGVGQELVYFAEEMMRDCYYSHIETHARIVAQRFYERLGYIAYGEPFMETLVEHIAMKKAL